MRYWYNTEITSYGPLVYTIDDTDCTGGIGYANNVWIEYNFTNHTKRKIFNPRQESFKEGIKGEFEYFGQYSLFSLVFANPKQ